MQLADLRTDVQVQTDDADVRQRADLPGVFEHLLIRNAELAVGLSRVDAVVRLGVDVRVDAQRNLRRLAHFGREAVDEFQLLDRLAVDRQNLLLDGVAELLVPLADARIDDPLRVEARLDRLPELVPTRTVDAQTVFADDPQQVVVVVRLDGVVHLVAVLVRLRYDAFQRLAQQRRVVKIERGLVAPEFRCDLSAQHNCLNFPCGFSPQMYVLLIIFTNPPARNPFTIQNISYLCVRFYTLV